MARKVYFVGSGPGNAKYITVMGKELLENEKVRKAYLGEE